MNQINIISVVRARGDNAAETDFFAAVEWFLNEPAHDL